MEDIKARFESAIEHTMECGDLVEIFKEYLKDEGESFFNSPSSTRFHHAYPGGLADHTMEVMDIVYFAGQTYDLDMELLMCGAMLHDIGDIYIYHQSERTKTGRIPVKKYVRTERSKVLGPIGESLLIIENYVQKLSSEGLILDLNKVEQLFHIVASHHGEVRRGWGSLVDPATPEAQLIHFADMISSRVSTDVPDHIDWDEVFAIPGDEPKDPDATWTAVGDE